MECKDGIHCFPEYSLCGDEVIYCSDGSDDDPEMCKSKLYDCICLQNCMTEIVLYWGLHFRNTHAQAQQIYRSINFKRNNFAAKSMKK